VASAVAGLMCGCYTVHQGHLAIEDDDRLPRGERLRSSTSLLGEGMSPATCQCWLRPGHVVCRSHQNMQRHKKISEAPERPSGAAAKAAWTYTFFPSIEIVYLDVLGVYFPYASNAPSSNHILVTVGEDISRSQGPSRMWRPSFRKAENDAALSLKFTHGH